MGDDEAAVRRAAILRGAVAADRRDSSPDGRGVGPRRAPVGSAGGDVSGSRAKAASGSGGPDPRLPDRGYRPGHGRDRARLSRRAPRVIFIDSNIPMYLVGGDHPNRAAAKHLVELAIAGRERLVTDAEVLQEILHRYVAIERRDAIEPASSTLLAIVDEVYPIELEDLERARSIVTTSRLTARDAVHLAVMQRRGIAEILTFERAFEQIPGIDRLAQP